MNINTRKYWGEPTWYLFHAIANNINETYYKNNYKECFQIIISICHNLPCPFCRDHAVNYINKRRDEDINNKEKLKRYLFDFHNHVNVNTGKHKFEFENIKKYDKIIMSSIINIFMTRFYKVYYNHTSFNSWIKNKHKDEFNNWWNKHKKYLQ